MEVFLDAHSNFDYDELCSELEDLRKFEGESIGELLYRFRLICFRLPINEKPSVAYLMNGFFYLYSLPYFHGK
jgi:hypothetical protein